MINIFIPNNTTDNYGIAADIFKNLLKETTGLDSQIFKFGEKDLFSANKAIIIGNDAVNPYTAELYLDGRLESLKVLYGSDGYHIKSYKIEETEILLIAGGCFRADLYGIYRFFEKFYGCRYFWDGDIIPKNSVFSIDCIDLYESPRFKYRGLRYFAHRSLHRFQAEHWSLDDWKKEIDWMVKKRFNLFMLRIGHDDIFQKAFGDIVEYPDPNGILPEAGPDHDDRTLFWPLEYRAQLRKAVLDYAFERGLIHPEDCGTITHWYSRTPIQYLEKRKPPLLAQTTDLYGKATGLVWDIRKESVMEDYFKLTETHIKNYGKVEMFHTIGLAERMYSEDRNANKRLKQYVYHKIQRFIGERYPNAPLLLASWDFFYTCKKDEVAEVLAQMDPQKTILLDYTSDSAAESNFTNWDIVGKFPWIFGIFQGLESNNEIRGDYDLIEERFSIAVNDEKCIGMILWPEMAHSDTLMTEYLAENSWNPTIKFEKAINKYCEDRYESTIVPLMKDIWTAFEPLIKSHAWDCDRKQKNATDLFFCPLDYNKFNDDAPVFYEALIKRAEKLRESAVFVLEKIIDIPHSNELIRRDIFDIIRTVAGRYLTSMYQIVQVQLINKEYDKLKKNCVVLLKFMEDMAKLLSCHEDYSMHRTLEKLKTIYSVNPHFEAAFKNNASNNYCRSYIYENAEYLYLPEAEVLIDWIFECIKAGEKLDRKDCYVKKDEIRSNYNKIPLSEMRPEKQYSYKKVTEAIKANIKSIEF